MMATSLRKAQGNNASCLFRLLSGRIVTEKLQIAFSKIKTEVKMEKQEHGGGDTSPCSGLLEHRHKTKCVPEEKNWAGWCCMGFFCTWYIIMCWTFDQNPPAPFSFFSPERSVPHHSQMKIELCVKLPELLKRLSTWKKGGIPAL